MSYKILEIFCYGGLSIWETFWVTLGESEKPNWRGFDLNMRGLEWRETKFMPDKSANNLELNLYSREARQSVFWGPATRPIWDIKDRCQMVVMQHRDHFENPPYPKPHNHHSKHIEPSKHEFAASLAVTGQNIRSIDGKPTNARAVALGTAFQGAFKDKETSYVLLPNFKHVANFDPYRSFDSNFGTALAAVGPFGQYKMNSIDVNPRPCGRI